MIDSREERVVTSSFGRTSSVPTETVDIDSVKSRAGRSKGTSNNEIYIMVERALALRGVAGESVADVGCGVGNLYPYLRFRFAHYIGIDVVKYPDFPDQAEFV